MEGEKIVKLARQIIEAEFDRKKLSVDVKGVGGVFVTLNKHDELRGCIGIPTPGPLGERLVAAAKGVMNDPRFPPLEKEEMDDVVVEVSVLTEPELASGPENTSP